ncbi:MAG: FAD-binding oxidoreductase [Solirubrobacteraceae bacterium]
MAGAALAWRTATVHELIAETPRAVTIVLDVDGGWLGHRAGQHVDVRLTAEDGYQAERSYSIASAPEEQRLALTVERIDTGEVSPYLAGELRAGDQFELRGPIGGHFTWSVDDGGPLLLLAGGSGLVPLMAMLRHRAAVGSEIDARLLVSARAWDDVLYREQLSTLEADGGLALSVTLTRSAPEGWTGFRRRIDPAMLRDVGPEPAERIRIFVCGPTPFVESAANLLVQLGHAPGAIHAERFGPTGG